MQGVLRAPLGFYPCKVDSAGRLKLPARYQDYLGKLLDKRLFVTEHRGLARIFTNGSWERMLERITDPAMKRRIAYLAEAIGGEVDIDPQGRITLPQQLRKEMGLEEKAVQLRFYEDVITIYPQERFEEELERARQFRESDLERLAAMGIDF
ncbi:MAG: hypothetical protein WHT08_08110 [Bryobacteraceae bacterium]|jgi:DNA-binding transcriptional regulator/RsmH inhibitor MraZ